jgi:large subunit ribosomal protein L20
MPRVKRGTLHTKRRKRILKKAKGFLHRRKSHLRQAKQALIKAGQYAYRDRRKKKAVFRGLWNVQVSAALKPFGFSYSRWMHLLNVQKIALNRKMLARLANDRPEVFQKIVESVRESSP